MVTQLANDRIDLAEPFNTSAYNIFLINSCGGEMKDAELQKRGDTGLQHLYTSVSGVARSNRLVQLYVWTLGYHKEKKFKFKQ